MKKLIIALALAGIALAQQQVTLTGSLPSGASRIGAGVSGTAGSVQACYYIVSNFVGGSILSGPVQLTNVPGTLNGSNFVVLSWTPAPGVVTQDVLKTNVAAITTCVAPVSGASLSLATGLGPTVGTQNDQGGALSVHTTLGFPFKNPSVTLALNNRDFVVPTIQFVGNPAPNFSFPVIAGVTSLTINAGQAITQTSPADGVYIEAPIDCSLNATTGAFAAANTTMGANPGGVRVAAGNWVFQGTTTAAANALTLNCDITPPSRLTAGRGVTLTNIQLLYGVQTTALTSITAPVVNSLTYPATGAAAGATVAAAGGVLTILPASLQLTTTTTGQCFSENISFGTPIALNTDLQRITLEQVFNQTAAAATQLQICGVIVHYTNTPL